MIRRASIHDAAALAELGERTFRETFEAHNRPEDMDVYVGQTYAEKLQIREIEDPSLATWVVEEDGTLTAFAQLRLNLPDVELARFYVDRRMHGKGIAQSLMTVVVDTARTAGARRLWLGVWEHNARAIAFYAKCGFRDCGSHPFVVGNDLQTDREMEMDLQ